MSSEAIGNTQPAAYIPSPRDQRKIWCAIALIVLIGGILGTGFAYSKLGGFSYTIMGSGTTLFFILGLIAYKIGAPHWSYNGSHIELNPEFGKWFFYHFHTNIDRDRLHWEVDRVNGNFILKQKDESLVDIQALASITQDHLGKYFMSLSCTPDQASSGG